MAIEDRVNAVRDRFDAWQRRIERHFDRAIELLRQVTALLNEIIVGITRMVVTLLVSSWKLFREVLLLFFLVLPFLLVIPLGMEIGGTVGLVVQLICGGIVAALFIFLVVASFVKIEPNSQKQEKSKVRASVLFVTVAMNILVFGLYFVLGSFFVPQGELLKPAYTLWTDVSSLIAKSRGAKNVSLDPNEEFYTYVKVKTGENVKFSSTAPVRLVIVTLDSTIIWEESIEGDTTLLVPASGTVQFDALSRDVTISIEVVKDRTSADGG